MKIALLGMVLLFGCNNQENPKNEIKVTKESESQINEINELELNNGEKWSVNEEMKPHIEEGAIILEKYLASEGSDYNELATALSNQNNQLIKSCTMTGVAHDELHKWLHPHIQLINKLKETENHEDSKRVVMELEQSFKTYKKYFQ